MSKSLDEHPLGRPTHRNSFFHEIVTRENRLSTCTYYILSAISNINISMVCCTSNNNTLFIYYNNYIFTMIYSCQETLRIYIIDIDIRLTCSLVILIDSKPFSILKLYRKPRKIFLSPRPICFSHRRSEGCGFDSRLGLRNIFLPLR